MYKKYNILIVFCKHINFLYNDYITKLFILILNVKIDKILFLGSFTTTNKNNILLYSIIIYTFSNMLLNIKKKLSNNNYILYNIILLDSLYFNSITFFNYKYNNINKYLTNNFLLKPLSQLNINLLNYKKTIKFIKLIRLLKLIPYYNYTIIK